MEQQAIVAYLIAEFPGVDVVAPIDGVGAGDTFFIYDPERNLADRHRMPFATIVTKDYGDFDRSSNLDRPGVFRLNVGVSKETFRSLFDSGPRSGGGDDVDYAVLDKLLPHPAYAAQSWVCVLNPGTETFERVQPLLAEAYEIVVNREARRRSRAED